MSKVSGSVFTPRDKILSRVNRTVTTEEPLTQKLVDGITLAKLGITILPQEVVKVVNEKDNSYIIAEHHSGGVRFYCDNLTVDVEPAVTKIKSAR